MVLLLALLVLARWKARHEDMAGARRAPVNVIGKLLLIALPALALPFLIRSAVAAASRPPPRGRRSRCCTRC